MAGNLSVETCGRVFQTRSASANYGVGTDGRVGLYVDEGDRSWASSSRDNDHQAVTMEIANDGGAPDWHVSDTALQKCIELCADICKRNGIASLDYTNDENGNLTRHNMFAATTCPGPYLQGKFPYIASEVNKILGGTATDSSSPDVIYKVQTGAFANKDNAEKLLESLKENGFADAFIAQSGTAEIASSPSLKSVTEVAKEVIAGVWGNGTERKDKLISAGYDYTAVQKKVNELL